MIPNDELHQRPDPSGAKHAPEPLFDDRVGEPGARTPVQTTDPTWREVFAMVSLAAALVLGILTIHPGPPPNPTVNISAAGRASPDRPARPAAPGGDELSPCTDPAHKHEKC